MKKLKFLFIILLLFGCQSSNKVKEEFELDFFYVDYCQNCENFKLIAIPKLKNEFPDMTVNYYELDDNHDLYDQYIDRAIDFDNEEYESVPFVVINNELAIVGYSVGEEDELIKEIHRYFNNEQLGQYFVIGEYKLNNE